MQVKLGSNVAVAFSVVDQLMLDTGDTSVKLANWSRSLGIVG